MLNTCYIRRSSVFSLYATSQAHFIAPSQVADVQEAARTPVNIHISEAGAESSILLARQLIQDFQGTPKDKLTFSGSNALISAQNIVEALCDVSSVTDR